MTATCMSTASLLNSLTRGVNPVVRLRASAIALHQRQQSTLSSNKCNPYIHVFRDERTPSNHLLTLLPTSPPNPSLAIGTTSALPPTVDSFEPNRRFLEVLHSVLAQHAHEDEIVIGSAQTHASQAGSSLGSGGAFFPNQSPSAINAQNKRRRGGGTTYGGAGGAGGDAAGPASAQGGAGGAGRGGHVHVYDTRRPPDFGRIPDPEDIFGSLEVDGQGSFVDGHGRYQDSGTYRLLTPDGMLGLTNFLREKVLSRLKDIERQEAR